MDQKEDSQLFYVEIGYSSRTRSEKEIITKKESKSKIKKTRNRPKLI
jgi:hypothetical protein